MKIASFDIGIRNLAYCVIESEVDEGKLVCNIVDWKIITLCEKQEKVKQIGINLLCQRLIQKLDECEIFCNNSLDQCVLENQPCYMNPKMKSVQMMLFTYLIMNHIPTVKMFSPRNKLNIYDGPEIQCNLKSKYSRTKFLGIQYCKYMIRNTIVTDFFEKQKKKDDLADSFLQGVLYLKKQYPEEILEII